MARGKYLLLLNNDTEVTDGMLDALYRYAEKNPDVGMLGCRALDRNGMELPIAHQYESLKRIMLQSYVKPVLEAMKSVTIKGMAHITGGGLLENIPRVLPEGTQCVIKAGSWKRPAVFDWLQQEGHIEDHEMYRVFNNGIGMAVMLFITNGFLAICIILLCLILGYNLFTSC